MNSQPLTDRDIGFVGVHELIEKGPGIHEPRPAEIFKPDRTMTENIETLDQIGATDL